MASHIVEIELHARNIIVERHSAAVTDVLRFVRLARGGVEILLTRLCQPDEDGHSPKHCQ